jgi:hypothetical protein
VGRFPVPRPPDIDQFDFCNAIDLWLDGNDIIYRGNIPEYADSWRLILLPSISAHHVDR